MTNIIYNSREWLWHLYGSLICEYLYGQSRELNTCQFGCGSINLVEVYRWYFRCLATWWGKINLVPQKNNLHCFIKFKAEWSAKSVSFLDTKVSVNNEGCFTTDLHMKLTDTHQYLHRDTCNCHPSHCKQSISYSQALRIQRICSRTEDYSCIYREFRNWRATWLIEAIARIGHNNKLIGLLDLTGMRCYDQKELRRPLNEHH